MVARQYDVNANQVFSWRKLFRDEPDRRSAGSAQRLVPVVVAAEPEPAPCPPTHGDTIEIDIAGRYRVRVGSGVDRQSLERVIDALERR
jgi:transposase